MALQVGGPPPEVLAVLAAALAGERFKILDRTDRGFRARYIDWFAVLATTFNRITLEVSASRAGAGTDVTVAIGSTGPERIGRKHVSQGLSTAVRELRRRGFEVTTTPWGKAG